MKSGRQTLQLQKNTRKTQQFDFTQHPIQDRFYIRKELYMASPHYNIYEGIDLIAKKEVTVYLKSIDYHTGFSRKLKDKLRLSLSPPIKWAGYYQFRQSIFPVQVHQKYGPSLKSMFSYIKNPITPKDFLILMYQLIRLVQKFSVLGYVYRQLDLQNIVFDPNPAKTDLFLLNLFPLRKRGQQQPILTTRFCSRAAHLGIKTNCKDDLQSICYILLFIFSNGSFLDKPSKKGYYQIKSKLDIHSFPGLPQVFKKFYLYTINLNFDDNINYFYWRSQLYQLIGKNALSSPYGWMIAKSSKKAISLTNQLEEWTIQQDLEDQLKSEDTRVLQSLSSKVLQGKTFKKLHLI